MRLPAHAPPAVSRRSFPPRGGGLGGRDGLPWHWLADADPEQLRSRDAKLRGQGFVPIDVAVACAAEGARPGYTALWEKGDVGENEVRLMAGCLDEPRQQPPRRSRKK